MTQALQQLQQLTIDTHLIKSVVLANTQTIYICQFCSYGLTNNLKVVIRHIKNCHHLTRLQDEQLTQLIYEYDELNNNRTKKV